MKNTIFISLFIILNSNLIFGQSKFYGLLSTGASFPIGSFSNKSIETSRSGYAKTGYYINTSAGYNFSDKISLELSISNQFYGSNLLEIATIYANNNGTTVSQVQNPNYYIINLFIGPTFTIDFSDKFNLRLKPLLGITDASISENSISFTNGTYSKQSSARGDNFGLAIESQLNYKLSERVSLMSIFNYQFSNLSFKNVVSTSNTLTNKEDLNIQFMALNLGLGIMYKF